jgi:N-acetylglutamate synthase-like GNAT family acetyltransferase
LAEYSLRPAAETDAGAIRRLILKVGINPTALDWRRFIVATAPEGRVIGCGQIKPHGREIMELASIAVEEKYRKQGIAAAIINELLRTPTRPLYLTCRSRLGPYYERFGFVAIGPDEMPVYFRRLTQVAGILDAVARLGETLLVMKLE